MIDPGTRARERRGTHRLVSSLLLLRGRLLLLLLLLPRLGRSTLDGRDDSNGGRDSEEEGRGEDVCREGDGREDHRAWEVDTAREW